MFQNIDQCSEKKETSALELGLSNRELFQDFTHFEYRETVFLKVQCCMYKHSLRSKSKLTSCDDSAQ